MNKIFLSLFLIILCFSVISATTINVNPYETKQLPQITSTVPLDTEGLERTYLYCSWWIDGTGQEAILMNGTICPSVQQQFTFEKSETYAVRIDYANIAYSGAGNWAIGTIGNANNLTINYNLDIPEPPQNIFSAVYNNILNTIRGWLCQLFPFLGVCS